MVEVLLLELSIAGTETSRLASRGEGGAMKPSPSPVRYRITLRPLGGTVPPIIRLKVALKFLLRRFRLRCESVEELDSGPRAPPP